MEPVNGLPKQSGYQQRSQEVTDVSWLSLASEPTCLDAELTSKKLIDAVKSLVIPFIEAADQPATPPGSTAAQTAPRQRPVLVEGHSPEELVARLRFSLPEHDGTGRDGLLDTIQKILQYSVNTWDQGFLDKLYSSTNAVHQSREHVERRRHANVH